MTHPQHQLPPGWSAVAFDEIDSTNAEAMRRAVGGERGPLWITARRQSRGRGRAGRTWMSGEGNLAATLLFAPACPLAALPELSLVAGVAAFDVVAGAIEAERTQSVRLKWPNDVLIGSAKVCGILVESTLVGGVSVVAIGCGINVSATPDVGGRSAAAIAAPGRDLDAGTIAARLAGSLADWLAVWHGGAQFRAIRAAWLERAGPLGQPMSVNATGEKVAGAFAGLDCDGSLLLETAAGQRRKFAFGDVALGPPSV